MGEMACGDEGAIAVDRYIIGGAAVPSRTAEGEGGGEIASC